MNTPMVLSGGSAPQTPSPQGGVPSVNLTPNLRPGDSAPNPSPVPDSGFLSLERAGHLLVTVLCRQRGSALLP